MAEDARAKRVLVVEDEPDLADTLYRLLRRMGHIPLVSLNGREAIGLIEAEHPDLILTDLRLPAVSGLAVLHRARREFPAIPVILFTAYSSPASKRQALQAGAAAYLAKPFSAADLRSAIERALASQGESQQAKGSPARDGRAHQA
jgi:CheY-like chemotaxis protein